MSLFRRKKKEEPIDDRTKVERSFEETGQNIGKKAGEIAQKGINKYEEVKENLNENDTYNTVRDTAGNVVNKAGEIFKKVEDKVTEVFEGSKDEEEDL